MGQGISPDVFLVEIKAVSYTHLDVYKRQIPDYAIDKIFDKFYSLPRPASGQKSTGLGLNFVQEVVKLHGGKITLSNHAEGGVIATILLPL